MTLWRNTTGRNHFIVACKKSVDGEWVMLKEEAYDLIWDAQAAKARWQEQGSEYMAWIF